MVINTCLVNVFKIMGVKENETLAVLVDFLTNSSHSLHSNQDVLFSQHCRSNQSNWLKNNKGKFENHPPVMGRYHQYLEKLCLSYL